jgi:hypothetical protein
MVTCVLAYSIWSFSRMNSYSFLPSPGRHCHSTLSLAVIDCHSLGIYILILLPLLSFLPKSKMTVSPLAILAPLGVELGQSALPDDPAAVICEQLVVAEAGEPGPGTVSLNCDLICFAVSSGVVSRRPGGGRAVSPSEPVFQHAQRALLRLGNLPCRHASRDRDGHRRRHFDAWNRRHRGLDLELRRQL